MFRRKPETVDWYSDDDEWLNSSCSDQEPDEPSDAEGTPP